VLGSGIGGCSAAALLAQAGWSVLVLEKNDKVGGILASVEHDGFKLDLGSHLVAHGERGPLGRILRGLGLDRPRFLRHRIPVRSRGLFELEAPRRRRGLVRTALRAARKLGLSWRETARLARLLLEVLTLPEPGLKEWDGRPLQEFLLRHTEQPGPFYLLSFLASIFFVLPPWAVSAGASIRALRSILLGYSLSYVEGGLDALPHALLGRVVAAGGEVVAGVRVTAIERAGALLRVTAEDGAEYEAPAVACNVAPQELPALLRSAELPEDYAARLRSVRPSGNAHQLRLGLRRPLVQEGCLIGGLSPAGLTLGELSLDRMRETVRSIEEGRVSDPLAVYAAVPTNYDAALGPPGGQSLIASLYAPTRPDPADPPERWRERGLEALASVIPGLLDELIFVDFWPVPELGRWMGRTSNAAISGGQSPDQVGGRRLDVRTPVPGLFLCGDGAGGRGVGIELAAVSGAEAAARILGREGPGP
jgi:prolycopene isomerase